MVAWARPLGEERAMAVTHWKFDQDFKEGAVELVRETASRSRR